MRLSRLAGRKTSDFLLRRGETWKGKTLTIRWLPGDPRNKKQATAAAIYVGSLASAKLHKSAVQRNRMRRRCREALRIALKDHTIPQSVQLLLCPRIASLESPFAHIQADIAAFLSALPTWLNHPKNLRGSSSSSSSPSSPTS